MGNDDLQPSTVRDYVSRAGGTVAVASKLNVKQSQVIDWARDGIHDDPDHAIALTELGFYGIEGPGTRPRCTILRAGELDQFAALVGGKGEAARWLGVSARTFRRYRSGRTAPTLEIAERIRQALEKTPEAFRAEPEPSHAVRTQVFRKFALAVGGMRAAAKALGVSYSGLYRYATGERRLPRSLAAKLLRLLATLEPEHSSIDELAASFGIPKSVLALPEANLRNASVDGSEA